MNRILVIVLLLSGALAAMGQTAQSADNLFNAKDYPKALEQYRQLLKGSPSSPLYQYRTARCLQEMGHYEEAAPYFDSSSNRYPLAFYYLAVCEQQNYNFDNAISAADNYLATEPSDDKRVTLINTLREQCRLAAHFIKRIDDIAIIDSQVVDKQDFMRYYHLSADAGVITNADGGFCYTNQRRDQRILARNGKLWRQDKLVDKWEMPVPLPIDSAEGSDYPFLMPDGVTLYFAAKGDNSMGGYDIFITQYNDAGERYLKPENLGFPYNSPDNDYMLAIDENAGKGWWCTDRRQAEGKVIIYSFVPNAEIQLVKNDEDIIGRAKLTSPRKAQVAVKATEQRAEQLRRENNDSIFVEMFDDVVYRHINDFRSDSAKQCYLSIQFKKLELQITEQRLTSLRKKYANGNEETKQKISMAILNCEQDIEDYRKLIKELTRTMRQLEKETIEKENTEN